MSKHGHKEPSNLPPGVTDYDIERAQGAMPEPYEPLDPLELDPDSIYEPVEYVKPTRLPTPEHDTPLSQCPTNLPLDSQFGKALMFNALNAADLELADGQYCNVHARFWLIYPGEAVDAVSGEVSKVIWCVLIDDKGRTFKTTSPIVRHRIKDALTIYEDEYWQQGIMFRITGRRNKSKTRTYHELSIVLPGEHNAK